MGHPHITYKLGVKREEDNAKIAEYDEGGLGKRGGRKSNLN